jgi:hypothetical protein
VCLEELLALLDEALRIMGRRKWRVSPVELDWSVVWTAVAVVRTVVAVIMADVLTVVAVVWTVVDGLILVRAILRAGTRLSRPRAPRKHWMRSEKGASLGMTSRGGLRIMLRLRVGFYVRKHVFFVRGAVFARWDWYLRSCTLGSFAIFLRFLIPGLLHEVSTMII